VGRRGPLVQDLLGGSRRLLCDEARGVDLMEGGCEFGAAKAKRVPEGDENPGTILYIFKLGF
jgi:hypothetical protein